jgi:septum site-determining protein MinD
MTRIISFASGKGGTGKTTLVANLGTAMAQLGKRVTILDADITMANLELIIGMEGKPITLHDVLAGEAAVSKAIYKGPAGVKVVPAGISLEGIRKAKLDRLKGVVTKLAQGTEILLIDGPSGLERDALTTLAMGDELVVVINPDITSVSDALKTKIVARHLRVKPLGVVITRTADKRVDLSKERIETILELPILAVVPEDLEVQRSAAFGEPVVVRRPKSPAARSYTKLAADLLGIKPRKAPAKRVTVRKLIRFVKRRRKR